MRIAFDCGAVHVCSGIAFIGVADDVFCIALCFKTCFPFETCGESCAAASAETGILYFLNERFRGHLGKRFCKSYVAVARDILFDAFRIDYTAVAENNTKLFLIEWYIRNFGQIFFSVLVIKKARHFASFYNLLCNKLMSIFRNYINIE